MATEQQQDDFQIERTGGFKYDPSMLGQTQGTVDNVNEVEATATQLLDSYWKGEQQHIEGTQAPATSEETDPAPVTTTREVVEDAEPEQAQDDADDTVAVEEPQAEEPSKTDDSQTEKDFIDVEEYAKAFGVEESDIYAASSAINLEGGETVRYTFGEMKDKLRELLNGGTPDQRAVESIQKQAQEVAERAKQQQAQYDQQLAQVGQMSDEMRKVQGDQHLYQLLLDQLENGPQGQEMLRNDPTGWTVQQIKLKEQIRENGEKAQKVQQEQQRLLQERFQASQQEMVKQVEGWVDPLGNLTEQYQKDMAQVARFAGKYGITPQEVAATVDPRLMRMMRDLSGTHEKVAVADPEKHREPASGVRLRLKQAAAASATAGGSHPGKAKLERLQKQAQAKNASPEDKFAYQQELLQSAGAFR